MKKETATRFFAALSIIQSRAGLAVDIVLPHGPAQRAGLKEGDLLVSVGKQPLHSVDDFVAALKATSSVAFVRKSKPHKTTLRPVNLRRIKLIDDILDPPAQGGKKCDKNCECSIELENSICKSYYVIKGNGPRGGLLLDKNCTYSAIPTGGKPEGDNVNCGTKEYF